jgi:hypothetical protein
MKKAIETFRSVDNLSGEILHERSNIYSIEKLPSEPEYIKLYVNEIGRIHGLKAGHRDILLYVASMVAYDGSVVLNVRRKAQIAFTLKIATKSIDNALSEFVKTGLLIRLGRSDFELNPFLFGKGDWKSIRERQESFIARLRFGPNGIEALDIEIEKNGQKRLDE